MDVREKRLALYGDHDRFHGTHGTIKVFAKPEGARQKSTGSFRSVSVRYRKRYQSFGAKLLENDVMMG